ncbi:hypothetical protein E9993_22125 [Labilibacter sediminis]|nr:hypothetical protein E9993_22125 [Labilibacter sediminis]
MRQLNIITLFILLLATSCSSYQYLDIDVLIPAKHTFKPEIKSVVLVDNSVPYRDSLVHKVELPDKKYSVDTLWQDDFAALSLSGLKQELDHRMFFDSVFVHKSPLKEDRRLKNRALNWYLVDSLCKQYNVEAVIAFEQNIYHTKTKVETMYDGYMYAYMDVNGAIMWRAYDNLDQKLVYKEVQVDTISWDAVGGTLGQIARELPGVQEGLVSLAEYMGAKAADDIAPRWETQKRGYYHVGNYQFMQATEFVRKDQWGDAIKLWKYVFDHSKKKTKMKAAYNLALASEIYGDYESAMYWIKDAEAIVSELSSSHSKADRTRIIYYTQYISRRQKVVDDLKNQVGGFE